MNVAHTYRIGQVPVHVPQYPLPEKRISPENQVSFFFFVLGTKRRLFRVDTQARIFAGQTTIESIAISHRGQPVAVDAATPYRLRSEALRRIRLGTIWR